MVCRLNSFESVSHANTLVAISSDGADMMGDGAVVCLSEPLRGAMLEARAQCTAKAAPLNRAGQIDGTMYDRHDDSGR